MAATDPRPPVRNPRGAGAPFVLVLITGLIVGFLVGQPTIGFLIGLGIAVVIALILWRGDQS